MSDDDQSGVIAFLSSPAAWPGAPSRIEHIETHGAHVFIGGERVLKIKRAIRYGYMDFSTLARRRAVIERELAINRRSAPSIYLGVLPITRERGGQLALGGEGEPIEWAVEMRRFEHDALLSVVARRGPLGAPVVKALAETVLASHRVAAVRFGRDGHAWARRLIADLVGGLTGAASGKPRLAAKVERFSELAGAAADRLTPLLQERIALGYLRRCHGDLHLANVVILDGRPTLFDALEFDEELATVDTLHDLAFLVMDLDIAGQRAAANLVLGHYLWLTGEDAELRGQALLPLFLAMRAAVRAMVGLQRQAAVGDEAAATGATDGPAPLAYLDRALAHLASEPPRLVAVAGLSGTGKSTLAAALAPDLGAPPGALHLRSDLERKRLHGAAELERLPASAYSAEASAQVYARLMHRAALTLAAGRSVIVDAVFLQPQERAAAAAVALSAGVRFDGLWLEAGAATLVARVAARRDDASDASPEIVARQLAGTGADGASGSDGWSRLDAGGEPAAVTAAAHAVLSRPQMAPRPR